jgi:hypothetical protein
MGQKYGVFGKWQRDFSVFIILFLISANLAVK